MQPTIIDNRVPVFSFFLLFSSFHPFFPVFYFSLSSSHFIPSSFFFPPSSLGAGRGDGRDGGAAGLGRPYLRAAAGGRRPQRGDQGELCALAAAAGTHRGGAGRAVSGRAGPRPRNHAMTDPRAFC